MDPGAATPSPHPEHGGLAGGLRACPQPCGWEGPSGGPSGAGMDPVGQGGTPRSRHQSKQGRKEGAEQPRGGRGCGQRQLGRAELGAAALPNLGLKNKKKRKQGGRNGARRQGRSQRLPAGRRWGGRGHRGTELGAGGGSRALGIPIALPGYPHGTAGASPSHTRGVPIPLRGVPIPLPGCPHPTLGCPHPSAPGWQERG